MPTCENPVTINETVSINYLVGSWVSTRVDKKEKWTHSCKFTDDRKFSCEERHVYPMLLSSGEGLLHADMLSLEGHWSIKGRSLILSTPTSANEIKIVATSNNAFKTTDSIFSIYTRVGQCIGSV